jgi:hypothetical protein
VTQSGKSPERRCAAECACKSMSIIAYRRMRAQPSGAHAAAAAAAQQQKVALRERESLLQQRRHAAAQLIPPWHAPAAASPPRVDARQRAHHGVDQVLPSCDAAHRFAPQLLRHLGVHGHNELRSVRPGLGLCPVRVVVQLAWRA